VLIDALSKISNVKLTVIKNDHKGCVRYLETSLKLAIHRLRNVEHVYIIGFRGHETFWLLYPLIKHSKIIFDEFINIHDWLVNEHQKLSDESFLIRLIDRYMNWIMNKSDLVLTDTEAHRMLTIEQLGVDENKIFAIPVGADESLFFPRPKQWHSNSFEIMFYGNMLPLHGTGHILEAIKLIADQNIHLTLIGGRGNSKMTQLITNFINDNRLESTITHIPWVKYSELPHYIAKSDLCLGGPFGGTGQGRRVITGKTYQFISMGKPTVIGKIDKLTLFKDTENSFIVGQGSALEINKGILRALHSKSLKQVGTNARLLYEENYSSKAISIKLNDLLSNLVSA